MAKVSGWIAGLAAFVAVTIACGSASAADKPAIPADARAAGMKEAPAVVVAAKLACTVSDARKIGTDSKSGMSYYEVACKEGSGYILGAKKDAAPTSFDCLITAAPGADGKPGPLACALPGNANPSAFLQTLVTQAGAPCTVDKGRYVGSTADQNIYEVSCAGGSGYLMQAPRAGAAAPQVNNCLAYAEQSGSIKCELTTEAQELGEVDALAAASGKCAVKGKRYMLTTADGSDYFEVACADGKGYVLHASKQGKLADTIPCANASFVGGGCTLTDTRQAMTAQIGVYSDLAKKAGFNCAVSKYAAFPSDKPSTEIVEMACSNRPDGGVGVFPASAAPRVFDCVQSEAEGYKCSLTSVSAAYPKLSGALKSVGKGSCVVSGARAFARDAKSNDYIEVACADGGPGWVIVMPPSGRLTASDLMNCAQAANVSGGCQLPTNKRKS